MGLQGPELLQPQQPLKTDPISDSLKLPKISQLNVLLMYYLLGW